MKLKRLKQAEAEFMLRYPGGFSHPDMVEIGKKHKMAKLIETSQDLFDAKNFLRPIEIVDSLVKVIRQSSMVSMFEKPKFRDFAKGMSSMEKELLADGFMERLHGNHQHGFEMIMDILNTGKIAKWTLISICPVYFNPDVEVFIKPTTVKKIITELEPDDLKYHPTPTWDFYARFRDQINDLKTKVDPSLSPNNAAFTGFLMMSL